MLLVVGDFNSHIDKSTNNYSYHDKTNRNGELLLDMTQENGLFITNVNFQKKTGKLWTYLSEMSGTKTQVDYILVNKKWKNSVHNCEAYNTMSSIGSDHRIVCAKLKLSLRKRKALSQQINYDWSALKCENLQQQYTIKINNRYQSLCSHNEDATESYAHLITANKETAKELLPKKNKVKKTRLSDDVRVNTARQKTEKAACSYINKPTELNHEELQKCKVELQNAYDIIEGEELDKMIREVESTNAESKHRESWKLINKITGRKTTKQSIIKAKSKEERVTKWYNHFQNLLGNEATVEGELDEVTQVLQGLSISDSPFTAEEYRKAKKSLVEGKASGPDGIPPEVLKRCDLDEIILQYANKLLEGDKPDQWSESDLIPIPKSGDLSNTNNYRGIALSPVAAKVTNKMLLNRIRPKIDPELRPNQNGFRPGRSTTTHILALRRLIEGVKSNNLKAVITFVDFKKAFDTIHRGRKLKILKAYDIPEKLVQEIGLMYQNTRARVITPDGNTVFFEILAGVLQGDTLAPYLFAIVLDYAMRQALDGKEEELGLHIEKRRSRRQHPIIITDTDFAVDIALISEHISQAQEMIIRVETETRRIGLFLNEKKTETMQYNQEYETPIIGKSGGVIKVVDKFKYLGGWMHSTQKDF